MDLSWKEKEAAWDQKAEAASREHPLKTVKHLPKMVDIDSKTKKFLKLKALYYLLKHDRKKLFWKFFLKNPFRNGAGLLRSYLKRSSYKRIGNFFLYGIKTLEHFEDLLKEKNTFLTIGFSYCHKPLECPSGRFTSACRNDPESPVCSQCFIGKCMYALQGGNNRFALIPTVHDIGENLFHALEEHPNKKHIFLITACGMTLEMFGDWGNAIGIRGIGIRLEGRICNTMKAFELSEKGIKPGLTLVDANSQEKLLRLLRIRSQTSV
jgi:hypothetical protein